MTSGRVTARAKVPGTRPGQRPGPPTYLSHVNGLDSFHVRKNRVATPLGQLLLKRGAELGLRKQVDLARECGVSESTAGRLLYDQANFDRDTLKRVANALGLDVDAVVRLADGGEVEAPVPVVEVGFRSPEGAELDRMLNPRSPLTDKQRDEIRLFFETMADRYRTVMRRSSKPA
jgi:transcriptional regulator with XRE-family HTH domain